MFLRRHLPRPPLFLGTPMTNSKFQKRKFCRWSIPKRMPSTESLLFSWPWNSWGSIFIVCPSTAKTSSSEVHCFTSGGTSDPNPQEHTLADVGIRDQVKELQSNERQRCLFFAESLAETLSEHEDIWSGARIEVLNKQFVPFSAVNRVHMDDSSDEPERSKKVT